MIRPLSSVSCMKNIPSEIPGDPEELFGPHSRCFEWRKIGDDSERFVQCHVGKVILILQWISG
jgi:hypothetical protein